MARIADIDRLRALAVIGTIYAHIPDLWLWKVATLEFLRSFSSGYAGVQLFFVISGYVISKSLVEELDRTTHKAAVIKEFFIKRLFRITPSAAFWIGCSYAIFYYSDPALVLGNFYAAIASLFNVFNIYMKTSDVMPNQYGIYWTLSLEEQFYLLFPALLILFRSNKVRMIVLAMIMAWCFYCRAYAPNAFAFHTIIGGIFIYFFWKKYPGFNLIPAVHFLISRRGLLLPFSLVMCALIYTQDNIKPLLGITDIPALVFTASIFMMLVLIASLNLNCIMNFMLIRPVMDWVGTRSFTIYLAHYPIMVLVRRILMANDGVVGIHYNDGFNLAIFVAYLASVAIVSELGYKFIELPMIRRGKRVLHGHLLERPCPSSPQELLFQN